MKEKIYKEYMGTFRSFHMKKRKYSFFIVIYSELSEGSDKLNCDIIE